MVDGRKQKNKITIDLDIDWEFAMSKYRIIYEDSDGIQDSICICSNFKPSKTEARIIINQCGIRKIKVISIVAI